MTDMETQLKKKGSGLLEKLVPVLLVATIGLSFAVGILWEKVSTIQTGGTNAPTGANAGTNNQPTIPTNGKLSEDQAKRLPAISSEDKIRGAKNAQVTIVEYSDLECPFCKRFHPTAQQAMTEYQGKIAWVYRHFPLDSIHPKARPLALATECAYEQGGADGFWKLVDKIYEATPASGGLDLATLPSLANSVGLDGNKIKTCQDSSKYTSKVDSELKGGEAAGVTGTPGNFIVNSKGEVWVLPGAVPYETLKSTIEEALKS